MLTVSPGHTPAKRPHTPSSGTRARKQRPRRPDRPGCLRDEVAGEPADRQFRDLFQGAWLLKQVGGTRDDGQLALARQLLPGLAVQAQNGFVAAADDQQRGGTAP